MKKKTIRTIVIIAVVVLLAGLALARLTIEPADSNAEIPPAVAATPEVTPEVTPEPTPAPEHLCTIEIRCDTVMDTSVLENEAVIPYLPKDGVILAATEVEYTPGETVFDVLLRVTAITIFSLSSVRMLFTAAHTLRE